MGKSRMFGQEDWFRQKTTLKRPFWGDTNRPLLTLGETGGQTVDVMSIFGVHLKSFGYIGSNELCGRPVASKLRPQQSDGLLHQSETELREILHFVTKRAYQKIFNVIFFGRGVTHRIIMHPEFRICVSKGSHKHFDWVCSFTWYLRIYAIHYQNIAKCTTDPRIECSHQNKWF